MQKRVVLHQLIADLWHNLLQDALDTISLYGLTLQTVLNQRGEGNREEWSKRGKKRESNSETLPTIAEDSTKTAVPQNLNEAAV